MFLDKAKIYVKGGDGGAGCVSFRREKHVPRGGPNGGDGGRGGDLILMVNDGLSTLQDFRYKKHYKAPRGEHGQGSNCHGKSAENMIVKVPPGTVVKDAETEELLADLTETGQTFIVAPGGRGGRGNARFANAVNRVPRMAEKGEPGTERWVVLELKLLADVGLLGYPSVGKSSILASVSAARPEVAAYHFTTLAPILGVVSAGEQNFVLADIPGLIEGAHQGVGLGHDFLRHVERTKLLIHVLDGSGLEGRDPLQDFDQINEELRLYNEQLAQRKQIVAINKMDLPEARQRYPQIAAELEQRGYECQAISAATGEGLPQLMLRAVQLLEEIRQQQLQQPIAEVPARVYQAVDDDEIKIQRDNRTFVVSSHHLEKLVAMTDFNSEDALRRFQGIWKKLDVERILKDSGIRNGDTVRIGPMEFDYRDNGFAADE